MIGFIIWALCGLMFIGFGISAFSAKEAVGFWANAKVPPIEDVTAYNKAVGKLWCVMGVIFIVLGLPLLSGQNSPLILISVIGVLLEIITVMIIYTIGIEGKYRRK
ncbi:MAG: hypothetical protein K2K56_09060 [Lachnospiraceae bacterium]|nr:hypothetical protein [Lachnospiraceae bacterium]MDE6626504.1 hypothetical protein [Lachnospiraceae bacterium]